MHDLDTNTTRTGLVEKRVAMTLWNFRERNVIVLAIICNYGNSGLPEVLLHIILEYRNLYMYIFKKKTLQDDEK